MGLVEYADRSAGTYSGGEYTLRIRFNMPCIIEEPLLTVMTPFVIAGNKRKLSVAMAMIGEPSIVFLDGKWKWRPRCVGFGL